MARPLRGFDDQELVETAIRSRKKAERLEGGPHRHPANPLGSLTDAQLVEKAIKARGDAEKVEAKASPSRWVEAECYHELAERGWSQRKIGKACGTNHTSVSFMVRMVVRYPTTSDRPSFWHAYAEITGEKTTAEHIVASTENEWYTPAKYIESARRVLGAIDLDPASCPEANETVGATRFYTADDDSLELPWTGRVWLNPPYGRLAGEFVRRLVLEYQGGEVSSAIALVNAHCTDTDWFQPLWDHLVCFTNHRIDFDSPGRDKTSTSTHGTAFAYFGKDRDKFIGEFGEFGPVLVRRK